MWKWAVYLGLLCSVAQARQSPWQAPPSWAMRNQGGSISVDLGLMQRYRMRAVAGQDIGLPGPAAPARMPRIRIAILDTGIDARHPAFAHITISAPAASAQPGDSQDPADSAGHGTHLAGIMAAVSPDIDIISFKLLSQAPNAPLMPADLNHSVGELHRVAEFRALSERVASAIRQAVALRAQVINIPFGWPLAAREERVAEAVADALRAGSIIVAAAGNDASAELLLPCQLKGVICVAARGPDGAVASFSNFGHGVDIAAPGVDIPAAIPLLRRSVREPGQHFDRLSGTSQASAFVAGAAALLLARGVPPSTVYARLVAGARPLLPETPLLEGPGDEGHAVESLGGRERILLSGSLDIAAALRAKPRSLILPASKEVKLVPFEPAAPSAAFDIELKNVWEAARRSNFSIVATPALPDGAMPVVLAVGGGKFAGSWPAQQEKRFRISLKMPKESARLPSELAYAITVSIDGVAQAPFVMRATLMVGVDQSLKGPHVTTYPIRGSLPTGMRLRLVEQERGAPTYLAIGIDPGNRRGFRIALAKVADGALTITAPQAQLIDAEFKRCVLQQLTRIDIHQDGQSRYVLRLVEYPDDEALAARQGAHIDHFIVVDEQMQLDFYRKYQDARVATPAEIRWLRVGKSLRPAWIGEGPALGRAWTALELLGQTAPGQAPATPVDMNFYYLDSEFRLAQVSVGENAHLLDFYFPEDYGGNVAVLTATRSPGCERWCDLDRVRLGAIADGKFTPQAALDSAALVYGQFQGKQHTRLLQPGIGGDRYRGLLWYARDAHQSLEVQSIDQVANAFARHHVAPSRVALDVPMSVAGGFQSAELSGAYVATVTELEYHDFLTGQVASRGLDRYTFLGNHDYLDRQVPIIVSDLERPNERIPALLTATDAPAFHEQRVALPALRRPGAGNRLVVPAGLRFRSGTDCLALDEPVFLADQAVYALDYLCGNRLVRIALKY